ncbi:MULTISPECIES: PilN domain-containing protein [Pseudomonadati]|uniref:PilN domain-containing protein n=1 Tax=Shewanella aestuarii TaxID=1028752 RepID=A0ABT0L4L7_9GAMM|nr:PilN domain-containing protein [Shewanella aestuarii]MCL1118678.1 PilN domain-containing protein [Shewanella aestuarii]GGN80805.1 MSHA biogenesis protein MshI2 [Shewanella aestuarii]
MIKTKVNLYSATLLPPKQRVNFLSLCISVAVLLSLTVVLYLVGSYQLYNIQNNVTQAEQKNNRLVKQKDDLEVQISQRVPDQNLVARVELEEQRLTLKRLLKSELENRTALISQGYSPMLTDLATVADATVWLSRIHFNEQQIEFEGFGQQPSSIPRWIERLKTADTLKGFAFAAMTMDRGEDKPLAFKLTSIQANKEAAK